MYIYNIYNIIYIYMFKLGALEEQFFIPTIRKVLVKQVTNGM